MNVEPGTKQVLQKRFTIRSFFIISAILAVASAPAGMLWRAANGQIDGIGSFVLMTSMAPLGVMIAISWFLRLLRIH